MREQVRQLGDLSGNSVTCKVRDDEFEIQWPDGTLLTGKSARPWDIILDVLEKPHYDLVRQAVESLRTANAKTRAARATTAQKIA